MRSSLIALASVLAVSSPALADDFDKRGGEMTGQIKLKNVFDKRYYVSRHQSLPDWMQPGEQQAMTASLRVLL